jgi:hypothetical protein
LLVIYHEVLQTAGGSLYRLGLALFDLHTLERCLKRNNEWIFGPEESYERRGDVDNVVFRCGTTLPPMATPSISIMARRIQPLPWPLAIFAPFWSGLNKKDRKPMATIN